MRALLPLFALAAYSSSETPLTKVTSLQCPNPGALPFRMASSGFQNAANRTLASDKPRSKDEASDTLGVPGGVVASVYLADDQSPAKTAIGYHGVKARTEHDNGLQEKPLAGENVSLWSYDTGKMAWQSLGSAKTDSNGQYDLPSTGFVAANGQPIYAMLEADASCAEHFDFLLPSGAKVVVTDIDGTLTADDGQLTTEIFDDTKLPMMMGAAAKLLAAWDEKGGENDAVYKTLWLNRLIHDFGWNVVAAYGNADTDISAYENAGIAKDHTFIVGPLAGNRQTVAIANNDFTQHISTFVAAQPANQ